MSLPNKIINNIIKNFFALMMVIGCLLTSCKKDKEIDKEDQDKGADSIVVTTTDPILLHADSLFYFAKDVYLWNTDLPTYQVFKPQQYANSNDELSGLDKELFAITRYAINSETGLPYEYYANDPDGTSKYSFIDDLSAASSSAFHAKEKSQIDDNGYAKDLGIEFGLYGTDTNYDIYLLYVFPNSPAGKAGLKRGDIITTINGKSVGSNFDNDYSSIINGLYTSSSVSLKGTKLGGGSFSTTLSVTSYQANSVLADTIYKAGTKNIGYLAFYQFTDPEHGDIELDNVFSKFKTSNVDNLIVDLRFNGGGYVATAEYLINLIAGAKLNGKIMFKEYYNNDLQQGKFNYLQTLPYLDDNNKIELKNNGDTVTYADLDYTVAKNTSNFKSLGNSLSNINTVVFIVSSGTASASELVINNLKPYLTVKLVGDSTTYGKPVGFFPIRIGKYDVYYSMFQTKNSNGEGSYFNGMLSDEKRTDNPKYALGDLNEDCIYSAYYFLNNNSFPTKNNTKASLKSRTSPVSTTLKQLSSAQKNLREFRFQGMLEKRNRLVIKK
ncbi:PDZ domain-containing protein [bacterium A37T11]|nr:PDZ domain-containing protein [bacterium A37T11]